MQNFARYLTFKRENNDLLLFLLKQCVGEQLQFRRNRHRRGTAALGLQNALDEDDAALMQPVTVAERDLIDKARQLNISATNLHAFFKSAQFEQNNFTFNAADKVIVQTL